MAIVTVKYTGELNDEIVGGSGALHYNKENRTVEGAVDFRESDD